MVDGSGSRNIPDSAPSDDRGQPSRTDDIQTKVLQEIGNHSLDEQMDMFRKATEGSLRNDDPNAQSSVLEPPVPRPPEPADAVEKNQPEKREQVDPLVAPIKEALNGPNELLKDATKDELSQIQPVLKKAGIDISGGIPNSKVYLVNAVIAAERILNQPGVAIEAIINDDGKFEANKNLSRDLPKRQKYGGELSNECAVALLKVGKVFDESTTALDMSTPDYASKSFLSTTYYQKGIDLIEKQKSEMKRKGNINANDINDGLLAEMYGGALHCNFFGDNKLAAAYGQKATELYVKIYNKMGPEEAHNRPNLIVNTDRAFSQYAVTLENLRQKEKAEFARLQQWAIFKRKLIPTR